MLQCSYRWFDPKRFGSPAEGAAARVDAIVLNRLQPLRLDHVQHRQASIKGVLLGALAVQVRPQVYHRREDGRCVGVSNGG